MTAGSHAKKNKSKQLRNNCHYLAKVRLTIAEILQSDDKAIVLTSCSLSKSQIKVDVSFEAY